MPIAGRGIPLERALFYYTLPEASGLEAMRLWPEHRADFAVFSENPLINPGEAQVIRAEVDGVAVFEH